MPLLWLYHIKQRRKEALRCGRICQDLKEDLRAELGGNFESAVLALCEWDNHYLAQWARRSVRGLGTDESTLIEIICGNDQDMLQQVDAAYGYRKRGQGWMLSAVAVLKLTRQKATLPTIGITELRREHISQEIQWSLDN